MPTREGLGLLLVDVKTGLLERIKGSSYPLSVVEEAGKAQDTVQLQLTDKGIHEEATRVKVMELQEAFEDFIISAMHPSDKGLN
jgi:hypothetical protein